MNIVSLEGRLQELLDIKETLNREEYYKYDVRINGITNKIKELTLDVLPKEFMHNMIFNSK